MKPRRLHAIEDNPERPTIMGEIEMGWHNHIWPVGKPWKPIENSQHRPALNVDEVLSASEHKYVVADARVPLWEKLLRQI